MSAPKTCAECGKLLPLNSHWRRRYCSDACGAKARNRVFYRDNRDREKARAKAWREENREKVRAAKKAYAKANREKVRAQARAHYAKNRETIRAQEKARKDRLRVPKTCAECGQPLDLYKRRYCSLRCASRAEYFRNYPVMQPRAMCELCGEPLPENSTRRRSYCSDLCQSRAWTGRQPRVKATHCHHCGEPLPADSNAHQRYCTPRCQNQAWIKEHRRPKITSCIRCNGALVTGRRLCTVCIATSHWAFRRQNGGHVYKRDWIRLMRRYDGLCAYCQNAPGVEVDHVIPVSRGGRHTLGNVLPACPSCNRRKHARTLMEWRASEPADGGEAE
jgi:predicted nucleic acid-binding Zn ribbon protein